MGVKEFGGEGRGKLEDGRWEMEVGRPKIGRLKTNENII